MKFKNSRFNVLTLAASLLAVGLLSSCSEQVRTGMTDEESSVDNTVPPDDVFSFTSIDGDDGTFDSAVNFSRAPGPEEIDRIVFRGSTSLDGSGSAPVDCDSGTLLHTENGPFVMGADAITFDLDDTIFYHIRVCLYDDSDNEYTSETTVSDETPPDVDPTLDRPYDQIIHMYSDAL